MNKFITVTGYDDLTYTFNISHIICVKIDASGAIIYHTNMENVDYTPVRESYDEVMTMINQ